MLQKCNLIIKHVEGKDNAIADALSRDKLDCYEFNRDLLQKIIVSKHFFMYM
jgi:hypothetical protein